MPDPVRLDDALRTVADVLLWCFILSVALLVLWFCIIVLAGGPVYRLHCLFFEISRRHFALVHYGGMGLAKVGAVSLFLFPYVAIRIVLGKRRR